MVKCRDCRYSVLRPEDAGPVAFASGYSSGFDSTTPYCECHWRPPITHMRESDHPYVAVFPIVHPDNWCAAGEPPR